MMVTTTCPVRTIHVHNYTVDAPLLFLLSLCHIYCIFTVIQRETVGTLKVATDCPYSPYLSNINYNSLGPFIMRTF